MNDVDYDKLYAIPYFNKDDFLNCDFKEGNSDPVGVDDFIHNRAYTYKEYNFSVIYTVKYSGNVVGFFTASMAGLEVKRLSETEKIEKIGLISYPALLLGYMGVEKKFRDKGIGKWICRFCVGLAIELSTKIACGYVALQTTIDKRVFYEKLDFVSSGEEKIGKIWMYRRIFKKIHYRDITESIPSIAATVDVTKIAHRNISEHFPIGDRVNVKRIPKED
jgi:GNAT superfamily N-acetyltransferase